MSPNKIEIKNRQGIGWIILYTLLVYPSILGTILAIRRFQPRLKNTPTFHLFNKIPLGNSLFWGIVFLLFGVSLGTIYLTLDTKTTTDWLVFYFIFLPEALTGFFLILNWSVYKQYKVATEKLLALIAQNRKIDLNAITITVEKTKYNVDQKRHMLLDLRDNGIIMAEQVSDNVYLAMIASGGPFTGIDITQAVRQQSNTKWTCPGCGASNGPENDNCEYCGNAAPAAE